MSKLDFIVDKMLEGISKEGYSPEEIKATVIAFLEPFFDNKALLYKYATLDQILSIFSFIVVYNSDKTFAQSIIEILDCYKRAYQNYPDQVEDIIISTVDLMSQKENLMWTVKSNTPNVVSEDIHEATYSYMKHIGDCLEIGSKYKIFELCAMVEISTKHYLDYGNILNSNFGAVVQRLYNKNILTNILVTKPNGLKLSDWRNIAYHHTYEILDSKIVCKYGKKNLSFTISVSELRDYTAQIIKACNAIDIARRIFIFDNCEMVAKHLNEDSFHVHDREAMKIGQLKTSMLSQGFKLISCQVNPNSVDSHIQDLNRSDKLTDDEKLKREIHCTQFLYEIWKYFKTDIVKITYYDCFGNSLYEYSVDSNVCQEISNGKKKFSNFFRYISVKKLC
ncbi:MAG: hypothetical protein ACYDIA_04100 [Candidatus Humimicrobiaceae bacterium]